MAESHSATPPRPGNNLDYEIYPLAYTQVDWRIFNDVCQSNLGVSPSRGIDQCYLDIKDPAAYLGSVDMQNDPLKALREHRCLDHFSISFIARLDDDALRALHETKIKTHTRSCDKYHWLCILTGSIGDWTDAIIKLTPESPASLKWIMTRVCEYLKQTGFREIFNDHDLSTI